MIYEDKALRLLFEPLSDDVDELYIVSAYATPTMLSWYMKNLDKRTHCPLKISLMVGMIPYDGVSVSVHEGFIQLLHDSKPPEISKLECSYIYDNQFHTATQTKYKAIENVSYKNYTAKCFKSKTAKILEFLRIIYRKQICNFMIRGKSNGQRCGSLPPLP